MKNIFVLLITLASSMLVLSSCMFIPTVSPEGNRPSPDSHECESICAVCHKCTDFECTEEVCLEKCGGHVNLPGVDVGDLQK